MTKIGPGEIGAFRHGVRRHRAAGCDSGAMSDCCLRAGMAAAQDYRHGELLKLLEPVPVEEQCQHTETLGFNRTVFRCLSPAGHEGDHLLALVKRLA